MVAAVADRHARALVLACGFAPVQDLVSGFEQQQIAFWVGPLYRERAPAIEVGTGQLVALAGIEILLRAKVGLEPNVGCNGRIDQDCAYAKALGEMGGIEAA